MTARPKFLHTLLTAALATAAAPFDRRSNG